VIRAIKMLFLLLVGIEEDLIPFNLVMEAGNRAFSNKLNWARSKKRISILFQRAKNLKMMGLILMLSSMT
jgi:hypothetical protein